MANEELKRDWIETSALAAPALLGAAAGILAGELLHRNARRGLTLALGGLGIAALLPAVVEGVVNKVNGPNTRRGAQRRLDSIRAAGRAGYVDDELEEHGVI